MAVRSLSIKRYKCFSSAEIRIENLSVLTGRNGVGKSTVSQALRLARAAALADMQPAQIFLNGPGLELGTFDEVLGWESSDSSEGGFEVSLREGGDIDSIVFSPAEDTDECEYVLAKSTRPLKFLADKSPLSFCYLSAERQGPRLRQGKTDGHRKEKIGVGIRGELCAEVLSNSERARIDDRLRHSTLDSFNGEPNNLLGANLEKWMSEIVGDIRIRAIRPQRLLPPYLEFQVAGTADDWRFSTNHGFGISYTLPIVLAALSLEVSGYLIVDTPEAHLHPAAQTALANFLARVAATGRTVIVETHSDHVVDGFRLAIANENHPLTCSNTVFHYFDRGSRGLIDHVEISPREDGSLPKWPRGFFDQMASNLRALRTYGK